MTDDELALLNSACDLIEQAQTIIARPEMQNVPNIRELRTKLNDARNAVSTSIRGQRDPFR
jgi:hypothetical protein